MTVDKPLHIYLIAGEASGDLLGAHLMRSLKSQTQHPIVFQGVGGERMEAEGLKSLFDYSDLSLFGFPEIIPKLLSITARINQTAEDIILKQPDMVITIDVPGFNLRVIEKVRDEKIRSVFVHYVAPTVWAYNAWRAKLCADLFDHMLLLLPFEPPYFDAVGLANTFVGHPAVVEVPAGNARAFRDQHHLSDETPLIMVLPGSRRGEILRHMPILVQSLAMIALLHPTMAIAIAVPKRMLNLVGPYFAGCPYRTMIISDEAEKKDAIAASNIAIAKSGTVTLEVAKAGTPMIVMHKLNVITGWLLKRKVTIKFVTLINLLLQKEAIPELLQERCNPQLISTAALNLLHSDDARESQRQAMSEALMLLTPQDGEIPSDIAATKILKLLPRLSQN